MTGGPGEIAILVARYGRHWLISEAAEGGCHAVRRRSLSEEGDLSNVLCAATLGEMARRLAAENEHENRLSAQFPEKARTLSDRLGFRRTEARPVTREWRGTPP